MAVVIQGDHTHAVLNNDVLVLSGYAVRPSLGGASLAVGRSSTFAQFGSGEPEATEHNRCGARMRAAG
ncbi:hypothetical protein AB0N81_37065 [Streptomyces sp. NPDC093510]|uniref:hypothetical protein n=1 Tax=Streptomyces sp. NPDC093510 TaxID=3155199 RepID=UPI00343A0771